MLLHQCSHSGHQERSCRFDLLAAVNADSPARLRGGGRRLVRGLEALERSEEVSEAKTFEPVRREGEDIGEETDDDATLVGLDRPLVGDSTSDVEKLADRSAGDGCCCPATRG